MVSIHKYFDVLFHNYVFLFDAYFDSQRISQQKRLKSHEVCYQLKIIHTQSLSHTHIQEIVKYEIMLSTEDSK